MVFALGCQIAGWQFCLIKLPLKVVRERELGVTTWKEGGSSGKAGAKEDESPDGSVANISRTASPLYNPEHLVERYHANRPTPSVH